MKVLFIVPYPHEGPSNRFRVEQYFGRLSERGIICTLRPFYSSRLYNILHKKGRFILKAASLFWFTLKRILDVMRAVKYDVVFVHREAYPFGGAIFEPLFKAAAGNLIYDFDDSIFLPTGAGTNKIARLFRNPSKVGRIIGLSDCVIAGNKFLAEYARQFNSNIAILPTCIDTDVYKPIDKPVNRRNVVIGWIGSSWTAIYLSLLNEVFMRLVNTYVGLEIRIIGLDVGQLDHPRIIYRKWSLDSELDELSQFDIGIMPLTNDDWAKGKCAFKIIQYMAVGIPVVASPVGMNLEVVEEGVNGFFADTQDKWFDRVTRLIQDHSLRDRMGHQGRKKVLDKYSIASSIDKMVNILKKCQPF